ncbi:hypothetical protein [Sinorhizobium sp. BJ1]|uniref:hypothetical protein n=1 Tax=Sinorhizobium sp. BJ1 TaxID=2035455 RepID=UPI0015CF3A94|nr:hypothetical protein [Sinorhizobium sp. BJ1]
MTSGSPGHRFCQASPFDIDYQAQGSLRHDPDRTILLLLGWTAPERHRKCARVSRCELKQREPSVDEIIRIGMDTSKHVFQLHGFNAVEQPILRKKFTLDDDVGMRLEQAASFSPDGPFSS